MEGHILMITDYNLWNFNIATVFLVTSYRSHSLMLGTLFQLQRAYFNYSGRETKHVDLKI